MKNKKLFEEMTDFDLGKQEMGEWLKRQLQREIAELKHLKPEEIYTMTPVEFITAKIKMEFFSHYLKQIEKILSDIFKEEE